MCRIAGLVNKSLPVEGLKESVVSMCNLLKHGGPDDEGVYCSAEYSLAIGNRRLALLDLSSAGHQPMSYSQGNYHITYNGELYNFPELKQELQGKGFAFVSNSDTEVILASFAAWGISAFEKFNGMFAFALWDSRQSDLYLVRDSAGIKPLYFSMHNDILAFASEVRAFKNLPHLQEENINWKIYMMAYGHLPEPVTILRYVKPLPKGNFLKYNIPTQQWNITSYNKFNFKNAIISNRKQAIDLIRELLPKAVNRHLLSDAPIGVFLSGGLDSSITALLANKGSDHLNTLSLYFSESQYSEKKYQDIVSHRLSCNHHQHLLSQVEFHSHFPTIIQNMDLPSTDGINTWFISKYAKEIGLKAVLSGLGGDELYGGYPSFSRINKVNFLAKLPNAILKNKAFASSQKLRRLAFLSLEGAKGKYLFLRGHFIPSEISKQLNIDEAEVWNLLNKEPDLESINSSSPFDQASWIEFNMYMQNQLLRDSDVMSMAHGVEIRVPFLDKDFITLSLNIRSALKEVGSFKKQLLIDSFKDILPEPVYDRPKMGFSFPFKEWLAKDSFVKDQINSSSDSSKSNYKKFLAGEMHWSQLMTLILLQSKANA